MLGFGVLLVGAIYIGLAIFITWLLSRAFRSPRTKTASVVIALLVFALVPTWDIIPGRAYFNHLCATEGGINISKTAEDVRGFYFFPGAGFRSEALTDYGYAFLEAGSPGAYFYYQTSGSRLVRKRTQKLLSKFGVVMNQNSLQWGIRRYSERIVRLKDNQILATKTQFYYPGNWIQRKSELLGGGEYCPHLPASSPLVKEFFVDTLRHGT